MSLGNVLRKAFMGGYWSVLYRDCNERNYREVKTNSDMWIADPFVYEYNGVQYLFVEAFLKAKNKGVIAYFRFIDGEPVYQGIAIEQPYHMSYPCIFDYQGEYYMIPETSANGTIEMYRAEDFPEKWVLDTTLLQGKKWVDTTVRFHEGEPQLFTYRFENGGWLLESFDFDMSHRKLEKVNEVRYTSNVGRPAGFFFGESNKLRPAQNCSRMYGEEIIVYEVDSLCPYQEHESHRIQVGSLQTERSYDRIHTINTNNKYEVVDVRKDSLDLLHGIKTLIRVYIHN